MAGTPTKFAGVPTPFTTKEQTFGTRGQSEHVLHWIHTGTASDLGDSRRPTLRTLGEPSSPAAAGCRIRLSSILETFVRDLFVKLDSRAAQHKMGKIYARALHVREEPKVCYSSQLSQALLREIPEVLRSSGGGGGGGGGSGGRGRVKLCGCVLANPGAVRQWTKVILKRPSGYPRDNKKPNKNEKPLTERCKQDRTRTWSKGIIGRQFKVKKISLSEHSLQQKPKGCSLRDDLPVDENLDSESIATRANAQQTARLDQEEKTRRSSRRRRARVPKSASTVVT
ncbi:hypothetical protein EAI_07371 [Harpegnathos saltator]|uniref:Uncharacterized protein n=1 Tax=Harpegnathos saltator TaxID=610380 RepID=E2BIF8_HARSA|nr:hypothetical protein EAI_07371 [Harpegnathos saltator]